MGYVHVSGPLSHVLYVFYVIPYYVLRLLSSGSRLTK